MKDVSNCCKDQDNGICDISSGKQPVYNPDDVTTWTSLEFEEKAASKLRVYWNKIESIKFLLRDGKIWVAGEQMQGVSDGIAFLIKLLEERTNFISSLENKHDETVSK